MTILLGRRRRQNGISDSNPQISVATKNLSQSIVIPSKKQGKDQQIDLWHMLELGSRSRSRSRDKLRSDDSGRAEDALEQAN